MTALAAEIFIKKKKNMRKGWTDPSWKELSLLKDWVDILLFIMANTA